MYMYVVSNVIRAGAAATDAIHRLNVSLHCAVAGQGSRTHRQRRREGGVVR